MNKKISIKEGDWIVLKNHDGHINGKRQLKIPLQIIKLSQPFQSKGDCNASLSNGSFYRLSTVGDSHYQGIYEQAFKKVQFEPSISFDL